MLEIPAAHPEIVKLVGRLNYRTSYTQNQWKHAIEAAYLCGMMADELGLDLKLARRAALMHDIGKALTHELDGSHAVIGADYARRLGEAEAVANAIGAHHTDEPFNSPYAYLVAAADAMSGGRPGARRQTDESYLARIDDLERITRGFRGVAEAYAVQGGREVRIYVEENRVDDLGAVNLSSEIAAKISQRDALSGADSGYRHPRAQGGRGRQLAMNLVIPPLFFYADRRGADDRRRGAGGDARPPRRHARDQRRHARARQGPPPPPDLRPHLGRDGDLPDRLDRRRASPAPLTAGAGRGSERRRAGRLVVERRAAPASRPVVSGWCS